MESSEGKRWWGTRGDGILSRRRSGFAQWLLNALREYNELWGLALAILLFVLAGRGLQWYDPTVGTIDPGILQAPLLALALFMLLKWAVWIMLMMDFPNLYKYLDHHFHRLFQLNAQLPPVNKSAFAVGVYGLYLLLVCILTVAIL